MQCYYMQTQMAAKKLIWNRSLLWSIVIDNLVGIYLFSQTTNMFVVINLQYNIFISMTVNIFIFYNFDSITSSS